jgi:hypothetical protein
MERRTQMGLRENFQRLIEKKQDEIRELEVKIREAQAYLQALQDSARLLPKDDIKQNAAALDAPLRPGSELARVQEIIAAEGNPMHVNDILTKMGKPVDQSNRVSLVGTLGSYTRKGRVFTRPAPNTFGLIGMAMPAGRDELPEKFGAME